MKKTPLVDRLLTPYELAILGVLFLIGFTGWFFAFPMIADDFIYFFNGWIQVVRVQGIHAWNPENFANYSPPNFYAIWAVLQAERLFGMTESNLVVLKMTTLIGALFLGGGSYALVRALRGSRFLSGVACFATLLTPTVFMNGAGWGQFDAWYAAFVFFSIAMLLREKIPASVFFFVFAFTWKAQAIFLLPAIGPLWIVSLFSDRARAAQTAGLSLGAALLAYGIAIFPAWTQGFAWSGLFTIYAGQADVFHSLSMNAPNLWSAFPDADYDRWVSLGITAGLGVSLAIAAGILLRGERGRAPATQLNWILFSATVIPFVLPKMHDRYFFIAEALATVLFVVRRDFSSGTVWVILQVVTLQTYGAYLFHWPPPNFQALVFGMFFAVVTLIARLRPGNCPPGESFSL